MLYTQKSSSRRHYLPTALTTAFLLGLVVAGTTLKNESAGLRNPTLILGEAYSSYHQELGWSGGFAGLGAKPELSEPQTLNRPDMDGPSQASIVWKPVPLPVQPPARREEVVVRRGDTLMDILLRAGVARAEAHEAVNTLQEVYDPRRLRIGQLLNIEFRDDQSDTESFAGLSINLDFRNDIKLARQTDGQFDVEQVERALISTSRFAQARVEDSLFMAGRRADVPDDALMEMIRLFSWDIDFQRDIQPGDSFELIYNTLSDPQIDRKHLDHISYAKVTVSGEVLTAYRFVHDDGRVGYYDEEGNSLRKWLMRTPIDGARMSSGFGKRRHPILGYNRMHKGIDFAAPTGTPIYAAGDGVVEKAGRNGAYGNYIRIRHNGEYSTAYAHLSRFANGLGQGDRVKQGEVIGFVGSTGRSTGPHLHYEVLKNGAQINPLNIKPQKATVLAGAELRAFQQQTERVQAMRRTNREFAQR